MVIYGVLHDLRQMLEQNQEMTAFCISGLSKFNDRAFTSLCKSLEANSGLETADFGNLTHWQFDRLTEVNELKPVEK